MHCGTGNDMDWDFCFGAEELGGYVASLMVANDFTMRRESCLDAVMQEFVPLSVVTAVIHI